MAVNFYKAGLLWNVDVCLKLSEGIRFDVSFERVLADTFISFMLWFQCCILMSFLHGGFCGGIWWICWLMVEFDGYVDWWVFWLQQLPWYYAYSGAYWHLSSMYFLWWNLNIILINERYSHCDAFVNFFCRLFLLWQHAKRINGCSECRQMWT